MFNRSYIQAHEGHPHFITDKKLSLLQRNITFSQHDEEISKIIRNLSDPTKLKIYLLLPKVVEISVTDIALALGISQSAVSHALSDLKYLGLVKCRRCGQLICYSINYAKKQNRFLSFFGRFKPNN